MNEEADPKTEEVVPSLKVGAHVLVQLGSELVTDADQAILECVKNAYDADSPTCKIEIVTTEQNVLEETGLAGRLARFRTSTDTVKVELLTPEGLSIVDGLSAPADTEEVVRRLSYTGRVTIEDHGDGLTKAQLLSSWLVVSGSTKRAADGPKTKTKKLRTPLGDKGLGRLGSMRLGDVLLIESATDKDSPLETAQFRWADCSVAQTIDEIPVFVQTKPNLSKFKGTKVSVLGLRELDEWKLKKSDDALKRSLTRLISPFEAQSTFNVTFSIDGPEQSLASITDDVLNRAIAKFSFTTEIDGSGDLNLVSTAHIRKRIFTPARKGAAKERAERAFIPDDGAGFSKFLKTYSRMKQYNDTIIDSKGAWFLILRQRKKWSELLNKATVADPGPFSGDFYYFHLDGLGGEDLGTSAAQPLDRQFIRDMAGITILRDGFRVRSQGDWLELAAGMTSGSTYQMRVNNTVGHFDLTGELNHSLIEKSDREGFVENAAYRGFMQVATDCRVFANNALENVRRAFDDYHKQFVEQKGQTGPITPDRSMELLEKDRKLADEARALADDAALSLSDGITLLETESAAHGAAKATKQALAAARTAYVAVEAVRQKLVTTDDSELAFVRLQQEFEENQQQMTALFESAAVGMSARGLTHELRTHLSEILTRVSALEKAGKKAGVETTMMPSLRAIRGACTEIRKAAALIDPMLPRSRIVKETFSLATFVFEYAERRISNFDRQGIRVEITDNGSPTVRTNRARLLQVLDNLVRNSAYWLPKGRQLGIERPMVISIELVATGFIVSDSGPGVDPRYEDSLFEIFVTAKPPEDEGQGLGLFIIRNLLQAEGCDLDLLPDRNAEGRRYRFDVQLANILMKD